MMAYKVTQMHQVRKRPHFPNRIVFMFGLPLFIFLPLFIKAAKAETKAAKAEKPKHP
jgi:hypothetical protein